jgi:hypothetical protein
MISKILEPYCDRLEIIREMLDSPQQETVLEAYDLLYELWLEYSDDPNFGDELEKMAEKRPELVQVFTNRHNKLSRKEGKKSAPVKKNSKLLFQPPRGASKKMPKKTAPKIFISYSHKAEKYKEELVKMLTPLQDQHVITIWQDREIVPGDEWYDSIQNAMNECDLALLLVSGDFLASPFIRDKELSRLLKRRKDEGLRIVPIIVSECLWQTVPILKDLQALPKNGKPVVSFTGPGKRDKVWTDIGKAIEGIVKNL